MWGLFARDTTRDSSERYTIKLAFNDKKAEIGESYAMTKKRLFSLERKLSKDTSVKKEYIQFLREYEYLGHMTAKANTDNKQGFYIPHHRVIKENVNKSIKLRAVFGAYCFSDRAHKIRVFRLDTVTQGTVTASFHAERALHQLVNGEGHRAPLAAVKIK